MNGESLRRIMVRANEPKEGDIAVGGTTDPLERREARRILAGLSLGEIAKIPLVEDAVTETLQESVDSGIGSEISRMTLSEVKALLRSPGCSRWVRHNGDGLSSEQIAAVVKLMTVEELSSVACSLFNPLPGEEISIGARAHFGSRIQPNSPADDGEEILFSVLEGVSYGCGDVILGVNPASDDVSTIVRLEELLQRIRDRLVLPVRYCVLSDMVKQTAARSRTRVEVGFQSLAGTSKALQGMIGMNIDGLLELCRGFDGLYFETGQGSAVTNRAAEGVDMVTLEARNYGLARHLRKQTGKWTIVNDVAGFIGPEVFRSADQLIRACLEDTVMAKLHGLCMGLDICSTFHMGIDPATLHRLTRQIVQKAAPAYLMAVAGNADPMLGYLTTSFREHPQLRGAMGRQVSSPMHRRLMDLGIMNRQGGLNPHGPRTESLYALFVKGGGDTRTMGALEAEGRSRMELLRSRGFDLGYGHGPDFSAPPEVEARISAIYVQARQALYSRMEDAVIRDASPEHLGIRTRARHREEYLSHPGLGETVDDRDAARVAALYAESRPPRVQFVISDGLNANAVNENLRAVLPRLRRLLASMGLAAGKSDLVVRNGRVRAGYHIGALMEPETIVHFIGERPGTGMNTLSAYLTYGRDPDGRMRWSPSLDHSATTAICGIHSRGKQPEAAADEIAKCIQRMMEERRSGVSLGRQRRNP